MRSLLLLLLFAPAVLTAQFRLTLEPLAISGMPALQSFVIGEHDGNWVIMGGRTEGLHRRQPPVSFLVDDNNDRVYVVDPVAARVWSRSIADLPAAVQEQVRSTNMEFEQVGPHLILVGGYGYSEIEGDHITFPRITRVHLPSVIDAVKNGRSIAPSVVSIVDERMAVTGGHLAHFGDTFAVVCGQRFDGRYNPMGMMTFTQTYTESIRSFELDTANGQLRIVNYREAKDPVNLHRRDYNLVPHIMRDGQLGYTVYSGVFQPVDDLPFHSLVDVTSSGHAIRPNAQQQLSSYHSAVMPVYSSAQQRMMTVFFGGMSQYEVDDKGLLTRNDSVPFVNTISMMVQDAQGTSERALPARMPGLLGSSAEFVFTPSAPRVQEHVLDLDRLTPGEATHVGTIIGGINSTQRNIFWINDGTQSSASSAVYRVMVMRDAATSVGTPVEQPARSWTATFRQRDANTVTIDVVRRERLELDILIYAHDGRLVLQTTLKDNDTESATYHVPVGAYPAGPLYVMVTGDGAVETTSILR